MTCSTDIIATFDEEGSGSVGFDITGLDDEAVTPNTFIWTLTDPNGTVINNRENIVGTPGSTNWVDLQGDDLALPGTSNVRLLTVRGTMDTARDGVAQLNKPYTQEKWFNICRMKNIPPA